MSSGLISHPTAWKLSLQRGNGRGETRTLASHFPVTVPCAMVQILMAQLLVRHLWVNLTCSQLGHLLLHDFANMITLYI